MNWTHYKKTDINALERVFRLNLINSVSGYKPANLIGSISPSGQTNLAIFSSVIHLGSNPALLGMITRPTTVERHSYQNIMDAGFYTINHVPVQQIAMAHYTSARFEESVSEFDACQFTPEFIDNHPAPFVLESPVKMGMKLLQCLPIEANGTIMIIGSVETIHLESRLIEADGSIDLELAETACISGLNSYFQAKRLAKYPYARVGQTPENSLNHES